ncbi:ABC transporter ATP-binding protein [Microvirga antarctica]|uniref:ABC transporter ATP-binding protein n=1 Tax=Microvirga antarctica TaxID=2819233 RepID=UPI001B316A63|nr:sn-glycerol-3-phosphate ABC transporter ATP-binding protein UgpC [Microvirga antarctica]
MTEIAIDSLCKSYGKTPAVCGIDLVIPSGEFVVILGPSGCGKSTLLRMIAGLEDITSGSVAIGGTVVNDVEPGARGCAMVFQNYALYPHMSVAQNIGYAQKIAGVGKREREAAVLRVATVLGLETLLDRKPGQLSGGQRQRVAMGRAMIRSPKIFLFDEPLSNLDAKLRLQMRLEIKRLHRELRTTSVFVTHDQIEAMTLADRLVIMNKGVIEQVGTPDEIFRRPASLFVADFLGTPPMNFLPATIDTAGRPVVSTNTVLGAARRWNLPAGTDVRVGVRPGDIGLAELPSAHALPFELDMIDDLGTETHWHGHAAGSRLSITVTPGARPARSPLAVSIPEGAIHLFRNTDGRRVDPIKSTEFLQATG